MKRQDWLIMQPADYGGHSRMEAAKSKLRGCTGKRFDALANPPKNEKDLIMRRLPRRLTSLGALFLLSSGAWADESATAQEIRELRQAVTQQTKQIELLAEQVGRLTRAMQTQKAPEEPVTPLSEAPAKAPATPAESTADAPKVEFSTKADAVPKAEMVPKAEPVAGGPKHTVAKGETLTSIAKQYNIPLADLINANKIENDRKLQIGQILVVPTAKAPETPDKKVNP